MKDTKKVEKLLKELKAEAETEFELHRIEFLERELLEGAPKVEIIDENHQKFNGVVFKNRGNRFGRFLSMPQWIYSYYYGEVPKGYEIHHIDCDPSNNDISNLRLLTIEEHHKLHKKLKLKVYICDYCGKEILKSYFKTEKGLHFCNDNCKTLWRNHNGKNDIECKCIICGKNFITRKRGKNTAVTCSPHCRNILRWNREREKQGTTTKNNT